MAESDDTDRDMLVPRALDRFGKQLESLRERVTIHDRHLGALAGAVKAGFGGAPPQPGDEPAGPVSVLLLADTSRGDTLMTDLVGWLQEVYLQFDDVRLPDCWYRHPAVIEELLWLRHAHAEAYDQRKGDWRRVGDWHDRYRPRVVERVTRAAGRCEPSEHCTGGPKANPPGPVPMVSLPELVEFWMRPDSATAPRPEPTSDELQASLDRFQST